MQSSQSCDSAGNNESHGDESDIVCGNYIPHRDIVNVNTQNRAGETVTLDVGHNGAVHIQSQIVDYSCRGESLTEFNMLHFFMDTYDGRKTANNLNKEEDGSDDHHTGPGRPRHERVPYLSMHPRCQTHVRIVRPVGHTNLPNFIGQWFPRNNVPERYPFYCACMLMLFKPWKNVAVDLRRREQSWTEAFEEFHETMEVTQRSQLSNIQYFYQCELSAQEHRDSQDRTNLDDDGNFEADVDEQAEDDPSVDEFSSRLSAEDVNGMLAVERARAARIFPANESLADEHDLQLQPRNGDPVDMERLCKWKDRMTQQGQDPWRNDDEPPSHSGADVQPLHESSKHTSASSITQLLRPEEALSAVEPDMLNIDQRRAYDIITWHLDRTLAGQQPPPLRMLITGEGGTGKSKVIQSCTEYFRSKGVQEMLMKCAYTGIAASLIEGKTCHAAASISRNNRTMSAVAKAKLQKMWQAVQYLIIDEFSMLGKTFLAKLSCNIAIGKTGHNHAGSADTSFGGINVILPGDPHQFPPVACAAREALYVSSNSQFDSTLCQVGRTIYEEFIMVVSLKQQMRVSDPVWLDFLRHLRIGDVQPEHLTMLRGLVLDATTCPKTEFSTSPWNEAVLVTPRHGVRNHWNESAVRKLSRDNQTMLVRCHAMDRIDGRQPTSTEQVAIRQVTVKRRNNSSTILPETVYLAIGMRVLVTTNLDTDNDIANGTKATICDIVLPPQTTCERQPDGVYNLQTPPLYILVKLDRYQGSPLDGLEPGVVPIEATATSIRFTSVSNGKKKIQTMKRMQIPITPAYACTDYRAQGQTIAAAIIDLATPPTGGLNLFNLYVALSRSRGRDSIRLLRDFDDRYFTANHSFDLLQEDDRQRGLDASTKDWWKTVQQQNKGDSV